MPAAHIQGPKSGCDWTENDLAAYNIRIVYQDALSFFRIPALPPPALKHPAVLHLPGPAYTNDPTVYELLRTMDLAMLPTYTDESAVDDFAVLLLRELGYAPAGRVIRTRKDIPLIVCGDNTLMKADVCIVDGGGIMLLLVLEDRRHVGGADPLPQLVAEAIAAFDLNNMTRERLGLEPLPSKDIPGITLKGTSPIFFKIPVTKQLVAAVRSGHYPAAETVVYAHLPAIPRPVDRWYEGMRPLDNRNIILSCYEALKRFVN
ncbi:hypothetical protein GGX14DRAFT_493710 [Mycena pura]|uniref:Uncharacterized protein n=1 Tax=Mycena pura TaxID=153505 RepID=A0AAD6VR25_9AGAR|nr:hypothetical protein GGX14DRAFT_493710 [Mycena pura]